MIPKTINLIWLGDEKPAVNRSIEAHKSMSPGFDIVVHRDSSAVPDSWRYTYDNVTNIIQLKADLIRFAVLKKYGGVYYDIDIDPLVSASELINIAEDGAAFPWVFDDLPSHDNDVIAASVEWRGWSFIDEWMKTGARDWSESIGGSVPMSLYAVIMLGRMANKLGNDIAKGIPGSMYKRNVFRDEPLREIIRSAQIATMFGDRLHRVIVREAGEIDCPKCKAEILRLNGMTREQIEADRCVIVNNIVDRAHDNAPKWWQRWGAKLARPVAIAKVDGWMDEALT